MIKLKSFFVLLFISASFVSCDPKDDSSNSNSSFTLDFGATVSKDFLGQVVDESNNPIQNATITIGTSTVQTDVNGVFIINEASVHEKMAYITAKKSGFIDGSRTVVPTSGTNTIKIMMLSGSIAGTVSTGITSNVTLSNGAKVTFDGDFKTETGAAYSGTVNVIMHHLDPSDPNVADKMPGMLLAEDTAGEAKVLVTYGMMNVELRGNAGQKLQIKNTAQIEMPITASQQATAPTTIPLWHFDETAGYWKEEGSATKTGNKYIGTVSHFSWWNCDVSFPTVSLTAKLVNSEGNGISNVYVELIRSGDTYTAKGISNNEGQIIGLVPANESLTMKIYDSCDNLISTSIVGPFSNNTVLPNIILTNDMITITEVKGTLLKCDDSNVTNGYVFLKNNLRTLSSLVTNGNFSFTTTFCGTNPNFTLEACDFDNSQLTDEIHYNYVQGITNVGSLKTCNDISEFISYQVDNNPIRCSYVNLVSAIPPLGQFHINGPGVHTGMPISLYGNKIIPGVYTTADGFEINTLETAYISFPRINTLSFNLNNFGNIGEYIDMTVNGTYNDSSSVIHTLNVTVHVKRY